MQATELTTQELEGGQVASASQHKRLRQEDDAQAIFKGLLVQQPPNCCSTCTAHDVS